MLTSSSTNAKYLLYSTRHRSHIIHCNADPYDLILMHTAENIYCLLPDSMKLVWEIGIFTFLLNKSLYFLNLIITTSFKTFRIMENEVASRKCDLMFNIMIPSLLQRMLAEFWDLDRMLTFFDGVRISFPASSNSKSMGFEQTPQ